MPQDYDNASASPHLSILGTPAVKQVDFQCIDRTFEDRRSIDTHHDVWPFQTHSSVIRRSPLVGTKASSCNAETLANAHSLHRKIPWRLSPTQKLRHRRRLRRVDNLVNVLDTALQRQQAAIASSSSAGSAPQGLSAQQAEAGSRFQAAGTAGAIAAANQSSSNTSTSTSTSKIPAGEKLPTHTAHGVQEPHPTRTLSEEAQLAGGTIKGILHWKASMPSETEMLPRDKYTIFDKKVRGFRKGVHKLPKWTRVSQRLNPPGF